VIVTRKEAEMFGTIWIPEGLYKLIPRASAVTGMAGLTLLTPSLFWVPVSVICLVYGFAVMAARI
jgi:hypothetical protein